ncbi:uncharacterized protein SCHCODRAFT_02307434 [Schizophyllum commune H4-8]|uniref:uncharacterized protein n=1 Tax=Schizophyllum commune (strain H4-8 / FGSC 9210) TaxID=578458 RepID=UPI002160D07F|nr:uncharacterized protein SCHCODRAFT_02307434 [Schizophyllum commune H4-8]KAI5890980.1 hypothetical protein SCHCODRAFT_02307434 [Schizophyllum commune H4-8]
MGGRLFPRGVPVYCVFSAALCSRDTSGIARTRIAGKVWCATLLAGARLNRQRMTSTAALSRPSRPMVKRATGRWTPGIWRNQICSRSAASVASCLQTSTMESGSLASAGTVNRRMRSRRL